MRAIAVLIAALVVAGCGHTQIAYTPSPPASMTVKQAASIVEQGFYEDYGQEKPQSAAVTVEYIGLSNGSITKGVNLGTASAYNGVVVGLGSTFMRTEEINQRIYFRAIGDLLVSKKNMRDNRYAVTIRTIDGGTARHVFFRSEHRAVEFADALTYLKRSSANGTVAQSSPQLASEPPPAAQLFRQAYKDQQIQQLMQQHLPYEEYMRQLRAIEAQPD